jgi:hypothetical protein
MKAIVDGGDLGELHYLDAVRVNLGLFQSDARRALGSRAARPRHRRPSSSPSPPRAVSATGTAHTASGLVDVAT